MKRTRVAVLAVSVGAMGFGIWGYDRAKADSGPTFRMARIERTSLTSTVTSTGTLSAVQTVKVGTQVSGQVAAIYVDFNAKVKKGELLARIDPTLQRQAVANAQAGVARVQAQLTQTQLEYQRSQTLHEEKIITDSEYNTAKSNYEVAKADLTSAQVALDQARQNLAYTNIYSPIDGVVVDRNVDIGQTVAASLEAPQLFLIANDLSHMQILASVDESDIGHIKPAEPVRFTVEAYPNDSFPGSVSQVRLKDSTQNNVVSYTAVVDVQNPDSKLLPGMTATTTFVTDSVKGVLTVANAALRYQPTPAAGEAKSAGPALWKVGAQGRPERLAVRTGLTDGQRTQVSGAGVTQGLRVIIGAATGGGTRTSSSSGRSSTSSPFQAPTQSRRGPTGPF